MQLPRLEPDNGNGNGSTATRGDDTALALVGADLQVWRWLHPCSCHALCSCGDGITATSWRPWPSP